MSNFEQWWIDYKYFMSRYSHGDCRTAYLAGQASAPIPVAVLDQIVRQEERIAELEKELQEQCRLNGMGSEREARLMARVEELEKKLEWASIAATAEANHADELHAELRALKAQATELDGRATEYAALNDRQAARIAELERECDDWKHAFDLKCVEKGDTFRELLALKWERDNWRNHAIDGDEQIRKSKAQAGEPVTENTSDGYHTFKELYECRHALFVALLRSNPSISWRANNNDDGTQYEGWFVAGMHLPSGDISFHMPVSYWELLDGCLITTTNCAPPFDGHNTADVIKRLLTPFNPTTEPVKAQAGEPLTDTYIQTVPDKCDRIVWRNRYYHLPINSTSTPTPEPVKAQAGESTYTTGHCENHKHPKGCQLHNLHCGYPACDRKAITHPTTEPVKAQVGEPDARIKQHLVQIHSALCSKLGDTDPYFPDDMTDEEICEENPVFWSAKEIAGLIGDAPWDQFTHPTTERRVPDGWKLVPIEPTNRMIEEMCVAGEIRHHALVYEAYKAMLDAAPEPTKGEMK